MMMLNILAVLSYALELIVYPYENFWPIFIFNFLLGFFNMPLIPISMDFACEITFPVSEPFSSGVILASGQLFGVSMVVFKI